MKTTRYRELQLTWKWVETCRESERPWPRKINKPSDAVAVFHNLQDADREQFHCLHLDTKNNIIGIDHVSTGSVSASMVHPREVYKAALLSNASAVVFAHNHPSGEIEPSKDDINLTRRLKECGELLGINVLDHIIIGHGSHFSFADKDLL